MEKEHHHVRFGEASASSYEDDAHKVKAVPVSKSKIVVYLGLLQYNHKYDIVFQLPAKQEYKFNSLKNEVPNVNCKLVAVTELPDGNTELKVELLAHNEHVLQETLVLTTDRDNPLKIKFHAQVLSKGQGTPALKKGITCTSIIHDEESEVSDW